MVVAAGLQLVVQAEPQLEADQAEVLGGACRVDEEGEVVGGAAFVVDAVDDLEVVDGVGEGSGGLEGELPEILRWEILGGRSWGGLVSMGG